MPECLGIRLGVQDVALCARPLLGPDLTTDLATPGGNVASVPSVATCFVSVSGVGEVSNCLCLPGLRRGMWDW